MNWKAVEREHNGKVYVFVSRTKEIDTDSIDDYLRRLKPKHQESTFNVPASRAGIFHQDLKLGLDFCTKKYSATIEDIKAEAIRLFPSMSLERLK
jgi:hypothetical protein